MSVKKMIRVWLDNYLDENVWNTFYRMACYGIIPHKHWEKFMKTCGSWMLSEDGACVVDYAKNEKVIYVADEEGILQPVE